MDHGHGIPNNNPAGRTLNSTLNLTATLMLMLTLTRTAIPMVGVGCQPVTESPVPGAVKDRARMSLGKPTHANTSTPWGGDRQQGGLR